MKIRIVLSITFALLTQSCEEKPSGPQSTAERSQPQPTPSAAASPSATAINPNAEAQSRAEAEWAKVWLEEGDTWVTKEQNSEFLLQIKGRRTVVLPQPLTEADRLNGVEWNGAVAFGASALRFYYYAAKSAMVGSHSQGWTDWQPGPTEASLRGHSSTPLWQLEMKKRSGQWIVSAPELYTEGNYRHKTQRPTVAEFHKATGQLTAADQQELDAEAAKMRELAEASRKETQVLGTYDSTNYVLSNFKHFKVTLTDVGVRIDNYYNMEGKAQGPVSFTYGDLTAINTWYGNSLIGLQGPQGSYSIVLRAKGKADEFLRVINDAQSAWKRKYGSLSGDLADADSPPPSEQPSVSPPKSSSPAGLDLRAILPGRWRDETGLVTYADDGTGTNATRDGKKLRFRWSIDGETLTLTMYEVDGRPANPWTVRLTVSDVSSDSFAFTRIGGTTRFRAQRVR